MNGDPDDLAEDAEARPRVEFLPTESVTYRPMGGAVAKTEGGAQLEFMVSPFKMVTIAMTAQDAREIARQIEEATSPIVLARNVPLIPGGRVTG